MPRDSLILVNTGYGKGKSSAAFGVMGRGWARGWTVGVVQFVKSGKWKTGERKLADHLGIEWHTLGDGFTWESTDLDETAAKGRHAWDVTRDHHDWTTGIARWPGGGWVVSPVTDDVRDKKVLGRHHLRGKARAIIEQNL